MSFMESMKDTLDNDFNYSVTENGALGYKTSGKKLLDLNFSVASMRNMPEDEIYKKFVCAYFENQMLAMRWLFFARDVRNGLGERRLFRVILKNFASNHPNEVAAIIPIIGEYGRFDDLLDLLYSDNNDVKFHVIDYINDQLHEDMQNMESKNPVSLLAKWLPSCNASSAKTKQSAKMIYKGIGMNESTYRKILSRLRAYIDVVECKMSANEWGEIDYEKVPSKANLLYNKAFYRNDHDRRAEYLSKVSSGEAKINAGVLFPHDIVNKYRANSGYGCCYSKHEDATIEALWKALPDMVKGCGNTIVVADGSGSMGIKIDRNSSVSALDVANGLAVYFAEHSSGEFKDKYITFSENPQIVDFSECNSLLNKLELAASYDEVANTNIEKVFDLILRTAVNSHASQEEIPQNILIVSDMEFDECATTSADHDRYSIAAPNERLFEVIGKRYYEAGYKLPRLVFWNVNSRTSTIPVKENDLGVALVSGFSINICNMVMSGKMDPYECLVETLMDSRYDEVEKRLSSFYNL